MAGWERYADAWEPYVDGCPSCGSRDIDSVGSGDEQWGDGDSSVDWRCCACGASWRERASYELVRTSGRVVSLREGGAE